MNERKILTDAINRVYKNGLTTSSGGNLSVMDEDGNIFITPSGVDKGRLTEDDIVKVYPDGRTEGRHKPSMELTFHSLIYKLRSDVKAVLHNHSPYLVAFSLSGSAPEVKILPSVYEKCGNVGKAGYDIPGSPELGQKIAVHIEKGYDSVMMQNHGSVFVAKDMDTAYARMETLELAAKINVFARQLGKVKVLDDYTIDNYTVDGCGAIGEAYNPSRTKEEEALRTAVCDFARRSVQQGYFTAYIGAISAKLGENDFLITPAGKDRENLQPEQLVRIKDGVSLGGKPDRKWRTHAEIYKTKPYIGSVFTSVPPAAAAFFVSGRLLDSKIIPESYIVLRNIARLPFGADAEEGAVASAITQASPVAMIENCMLVAAGETLAKAFDRTEVTEASAKNLLIAGQLGDIIVINDKEINKIDDYFNLPR